MNGTAATRQPSTRPTHAAATVPRSGLRVIPHTAAVTTLGRRRRGDRVNLEFDVIAKYVERLLEK